MSRITVGIPVWNGAPFLAECIRSLRAQSRGSFRAIVSVDLSSDDSVAVAERAAMGDARFSIVTHRRRLGWVDNANFLRECAGSEWFCVLPQDDLLAPRYFELLLEAASCSPAASVVYADLEIFGPESWVMEQESLRGPAADRALRFVGHHFDAVAYRGLVRGPLARRHRLEDAAAGGFAADTLWLLDLATEGELVRVPAVAYRKRVHGRSMVARWKRWRPEEARDAWIRHCVACGRRLLRQAWAAPRRGELVAALEDRLLQRRAPLWPAVAPPADAGEDASAAWREALLRDFHRSLAPEIAPAGESAA
ncbi:MAG: glycosyltransferase family 2 protein [Acidobacteriota bacterium]